VYAMLVEEEMYRTKMSLKTVPRSRLCESLANESPSLFANVRRGNEDEAGFDISHDPDRLSLKKRCPLSRCEAA